MAQSVFRRKLIARYAYQGAFAGRGRLFTVRSSLLFGIESGDYNNQYGRQWANVYVDGELVAERSWYFADRNPYKRWLEDEFEIPARYTAGKTDITVRLAFVQAGENRAWNEFYYGVFSLS